MGDPKIDSELLQNSGFRLTATTNGCYQEFYNRLVAANHLDLDPAELGIRVTTDDYDLVEPFLNEFIRTTRVLFFSSYEAYSTAVDKREKDRALEAWAKSAVDATATQQTAATTATANLTSPELGDLIISKVAEQTKKLTLEQDRLKRQLQ